MEGKHFTDCKPTVARESSLTKKTNRHQTQYVGILLFNQNIHYGVLARSCLYLTSASIVSWLTCSGNLLYSWELNYTQDNCCKGGHGGYTGVKHGVKVTFSRQNGPLHHPYTWITPHKQYRDILLGFFWLWSLWQWTFNRQIGEFLFFTQVSTWQSCLKTPCCTSCVMALF